MPLGLGFNDRLGHAFEDAMNFADWYRENEAVLVAQPFTNYVAAAAWKAGQDAGREQAANLVQRVRYPKFVNGVNVGGQRGSAFSHRAAGYGAFGGPAHTQRSNDGVVLIVMIETPQGVENAAAIAAVDGVDGVFIGPNDLAHSMGCENRWNEEPVQRAIEKTLRSVSAAGKCPGILALSAADEDHYAAWGARYFASVSTGLISKAFKDAAQGGRAVVSY